METRRCPRCNKLLRADAENCRRCGIAIPVSKGTRKLSGHWDDASPASQPTNPLASPHRAGHYSGLHPEDQPFQSSFFQRISRESPPAPDPSTLDENELLEPIIEQEENFWQEVKLSPELEEDDSTPDERRIADLPTRYPLTGYPAPGKPTATRQRPRAFLILITISLVSFLVASGLLTFLLLGKSPAHSAGPQLLAMPGELRVGDLLQLTGSGFHTHSNITLTRDTQIALLNNQGAPVVATTDSRGGFQAHIPVTASWKIGVHNLSALDATKARGDTSITIQAPQTGPPSLNLGNTHLDLGSGGPGQVSRRSLTLTNTGGGQVIWQAKSSAAWLSLTPSSGTFAGSTLTMLVINRANLDPQAYLGHITFTQAQGAVQTLYVSMTVSTTPANLSLSATSLTFTGTPAQSPAGQTLILENQGGQTLDWAAGSTTSDGADWLSLTPASGTLGANASTTLAVKASSLNMAPGSYQGALDFSYAQGPQEEVSITLTVNLPPLAALRVTPASLSFTSNQGFNPAPQNVTLANTGTATLNWGLQEDSNGLAYLKVSPASGSLAPGQSIGLVVAPQLGSTGGSLASTLTILDSDKGTTVASKQVNINLAITDEPLINLLTGNLEFDHSSQVNDTSEFIIFDNTGNLTLNWSMAVTTSTPWLTFDSSSGALEPGGFAFVTVRSLSNQLKAGTYTVTVTLKDTDAHTVVASQSFKVTLIISG